MEMRLTLATMGAGREKHRRHGDAMIAATNGESVTYVYATTTEGRTALSDRRQQERDHRGGILQDRVPGDSHQAGGRGVRRHLRHLGLACAGRQDR